MGICIYIYIVNNRGFLAKYYSNLLYDFPYKNQPSNAQARTSNSVQCTLVFRTLDLCEGVLGFRV